MRIRTKSSSAFVFKTALPWLIAALLGLKQWEQHTGYEPKVLDLASVGNEAVALCFTPGENCTQLIIDQIDQAQRSVQVQAYSFTSSPIAKALVRAQKRGVEVEVILDESQRSEKYSSADFLQHAGIATHIDAKHSIAHNKVMILDAQTVLTGSFNFTQAAQERNAENLVILRSSQLADFYLRNWEKHRNHSESSL